MYFLTHQFRHTFSYKICNSTYLFQSKLLELLQTRYGISRLIDAFLARLVGAESRGVIPTSS